MRGPVGLVSLVLAASLLVGCGGDDRGDYCQAVEEHQRELGELDPNTDPGAIFTALEHYRALAEEAPSDIQDEWTQVITRIEAVETALEDAGVDPSTFDPQETLKELSKEERQAVTGAGRDLGDDQTRQAMEGLKQQALDVCKTPLTQ
ncbi:hypothetical protein [Nocardioides piscis]|uniref:Lipoprotein n=1 Tax=Nocardioides piscis TaxID=2714938 RepID=A0A6G7YI20_9ACTN|nr:hypothetical protein [Nocardioides piscis]QIK76379.1 hypothetical protein G7071_14060 [Nocardioides piscis]